MLANSASHANAGLAHGLGLRTPAVSDRNAGQVPLAMHMQPC